MHQRVRFPSSVPNNAGLPELAEGNGFVSRRRKSIAGSNPVSSTKYQKDLIMDFQGSGILQYDPPRPGMKRRTSWWIIVNVDREITRYYRWWVKSHYWIDLHQPAWNAHISVLRGEQPRKDLMHLWKKYDGQRVDFEYSHNVCAVKNSVFWTVEVTSEFLTGIRDEFEVPSDWPFHLTIGKTPYV